MFSRLAQRIISYCRRFAERQLPWRWLALVVVFGLLAVVLPARAQEAPPRGFWGNMAGYLYLFLSYGLQAIAALVGQLTIFITNLLTEVIVYNNFVNFEAVTLGWTILRDISNMFFVIVLLIIAIATILRQEQYSLKRLLPKLLIMAILVNFSRQIAGLIIDAAQVVTLTFANAVVSVTAGNLYAKFGLAEIFAISQYSFLSGSSEVSNQMFYLFLSLLLATFMLVIAFCVILAYLVIFLLRVVALWILVILSPLAYVLATFPQGERYSREWWSTFSKYVIVGPILMFFFWLAIATSQKAFTLTKMNANQVLAAGGKLSAADQVGIGAAGSKDNMLSFIIMTSLMLGGLVAAQRSSVMGSQFAGNILSSMRQYGMRLARTGVRIATLPIRKPYQAARWGAREGIYGVGRVWDRFAARRYRESMAKQADKGKLRPVSSWKWLSPTVLKQGWRKSRETAERKSFPEAVGFGADEFNKMFKKHWTMRRRVLGIPIPTLQGEITYERRKALRSEVNKVASEYSPFTEQEKAAAMKRAVEAKDKVTAMGIALAKLDVSQDDDDITGFQGEIYSQEALMADLKQRIGKTFGRGTAEELGVLMRERAEEKVKDRYLGLARTKQVLDKHGRPTGQIINQLLDEETAQQELYEETGVKHGLDSPAVERKMQEMIFEQVKSITNRQKLESVAGSLEGKIDRLFFPVAQPFLNLRTGGGRLHTPGMESPSFSNMGRQSKRGMVYAAGLPNDTLAEVLASRGHVAGGRGPEWGGHSKDLMHEGEDAADPAWVYDMLRSGKWRPVATFMAKTEWSPEEVYETEQIMKKMGVIDPHGRSDWHFENYAPAQFVGKEKPTFDVDKLKGLRAGAAALPEHLQQLIDSRTEAEWKDYAKLGYAGVTPGALDIKKKPAVLKEQKAPAPEIFNRGLSNPSTGYAYEFTRAGGPGPAPAPGGVPGGTAPSGAAAGGRRGPKPRPLRGGLNPAVLANSEQAMEAVQRMTGLRGAEANAAYNRVKVDEIKVGTLYAAEEMVRHQQESKAAAGRDDDSLRGVSNVERRDKEFLDAHPALADSVRVGVNFNSPEAQELYGVEPADLSESFTDEDKREFIVPRLSQQYGEELKARAEAFRNWLAQEAGVAPETLTPKQLKSEYGDQLAGLELMHSKEFQNEIVARKANRNVSDMSEDELKAGRYELNKNEGELRRAYEAQYGQLYVTDDDAAYAGHLVPDLARQEFASDTTSAVQKVAVIREGYGEEVQRKSEEALAKIRADTGLDEKEAKKKYDEDFADQIREGKLYDASWIDKKGATGDVDITKGNVIERRDQEGKILSHRYRDAGQQAQAEMKALQQMYSDDGITKRQQAFQAKLEAAPKVVLHNNAAARVNKFRADRHEVGHYYKDAVAEEHLQGFIDTLEGRQREKFEQMGADEYMAESFGRNVGEFALTPRSKEYLDKLGYKYRGSPAEPPPSGTGSLQDAVRELEQIKRAREQQPAGQAEKLMGDSAARMAKLNSEIVNARDAVRRAEFERDKSKRTAAEEIRKAQAEEKELMAPVVEHNQKAQAAWERYEDSGDKKDLEESERESEQVRKLSAERDPQRDAIQDRINKQQQHVADHQSRYDQAVQRRDKLEDAHEGEKQSYDRRMDQMMRFMSDEQFTEFTPKIKAAWKEMYQKAPAGNTKDALDELGNRLNTRISASRQQRDQLRQATGLRRGLGSKEENIAWDFGREYLHERDQREPKLKEIQGKIAAQEAAAESKQRDINEADEKRIATDRAKAEHVGKAKEYTRNHQDDEAAKEMKKASSADQRSAWWASVADDRRKDLNKIEEKRKDYERQHGGLLDEAERRRGRLKGNLYDTTRSMSLEQITEHGKRAEDDREYYVEAAKQLTAQGKGDEAKQMLGRAEVAQEFAEQLGRAWQERQLTEAPKIAEKELAQAKGRQNLTAVMRMQAEIELQPKLKKLDTQDQAVRKEISRYKKELQDALDAGNSVQHDKAQAKLTKLQGKRKGIEDQRSEIAKTFEGWEKKTAAAAEDVKQAEENLKAAKAAKARRQAPPPPFAPAKAGVPPSLPPPGPAPAPAVVAVPPPVELRDLNNEELKKELETRYTAATEVFSRHSEAIGDEKTALADQYAKAKLRHDEALDEWERRQGAPAPAAAPPPRPGAAPSTAAAPTPSPQAAELLDERATETIAQQADKLQEAHPSEIMKVLTHISAGIQRMNQSMAMLVEGELEKQSKGQPDKAEQAKGAKNNIDNVQSVLQSAIADHEAGKPVNQIETEYKRKTVDLLRQLVKNVREMRLSEHEPRTPLPQEPLEPKAGEASGAEEEPLG